MARNNKKCRSPVRSQKCRFKTRISIHFVSKFARFSAALHGILFSGILLSLQGRVLVVNNQCFNASDTNGGTEVLPLKTIQAAANRAQPGDTVLVKAGIYREWIKPPRGGLSEQQRIVYRAAPGENVSIRGSEQIKTWVDEGANVWRAELDSIFFGPTNPYIKNLSGGWLEYGSNMCRGEVYLNGEAFFQKMTVGEVQSMARTWYTTQMNGKTRIYANFGSVDPNSNLAEINARKFVFFPDLEGLGYITIEGFDIRHSADYWCYHAQPNGQGGAVGPNFGLRWIIQNCTISDAKCIGIGIGTSLHHNIKPLWPPQGVGLPNGATFGHHIIRNNHITRCGQAAIYGSAGGWACIIENNVIDRIGYKHEFGGWEKALIKLHYGIDAVIRDNWLSVLPMNQNDCPAIFLDQGNQNARISSNVIYVCLRAPFDSIQAGSGLKLELNHGPILVDNNILVNAEIGEYGSAGVFVHNLFCNCWFVFSKEHGSRCSNTFLPHSTADAADLFLFARDDRVLNNIVIGKGTACCDTSPPNYRIDYNLYLDGAAKKVDDDAASLVDPAPANCSFVQNADQVNLTLNLSAASIAMKCPQVKAEDIGRFEVPGMYIEEPDGTPITIAADYFGEPVVLDHIIPGPIQSLKEGTNSLLLWPKTGGTAVAAASGGWKGAAVDGIGYTHTAVYDPMGRRISHLSGPSSKTSALISSGIYIVEINGGKGSIIRRMTISR